MYSIHGSCVTRDIFSECQRDEEVQQYMARCSLLSRVSPAVPGAEQLSLDAIKSGFQRRMVRHDLAKTGLRYTEGMWLIVDFIDERFRVLSVGEARLTESHEFRRAGMGEKLGAKLVFERGTPQDMEAWEQACALFGNNLREAGVRPILHEPMVFIPSRLASI